MAASPPRGLTTNARTCSSGCRATRNWRLRPVGVAEAGIDMSALPGNPGLALTPACPSTLQTGSALNAIANRYRTAARASTTGAGRSVQPLLRGSWSGSTGTGVRHAVRQVEVGWIARHGGRRHTGGGEGTRGGRLGDEGLPGGKRKVYTTKDADLGLVASAAQPRLRHGDEVERHASFLHRQGPVRPGPHAAT